VGLGGKKHLGIIHFRLGQRDGVSLEIDKRIKLLQKHPLKITLIGGNIHPHYPQESHYFPWLDLDRPQTQEIFHGFLKGSFASTTEAQKRYYQLEQRYYRAWCHLFQERQFDFLLIHNLLSLPLILPATTALVRALDHYQIPSLALNHDFWFNRDYFQVSPYRFVRMILSQLPPKRSFIHHQVINSLDQKELLRRRAIRAERIGDYWDFDQPPLERDQFNQDFLAHFGLKENDFLILQATRIVPRKAIENSILFAVELKRQLKKHLPWRLNQKRLTSTSRVVLFCSNFPDLDYHWYQEKLEQLARAQGVTVIWAHDQIALHRSQHQKQKIFSFWDPYLFADLVTYPSIKEGFGNQFLEAVFFKKPIVLFEYPVFRVDIKPEGYRYISLGQRSYRRQGFNFVPRKQIRKAAEKALHLLSQPQLCREWAEINFRLARRHHSFDRLSQDLARNILSRI